MRQVRSVLAIVFALILCSGLAYGQDTGIPDSLWWESPATWIIDDLDDTTFCLSLYARTDQTLTAIGLPFWVRVDSENLDPDVWNYTAFDVHFLGGDGHTPTVVPRWATDIDSMIYVERFTWGDSVDADTKVPLQRTILDTMIADAYKWGHGTYPERSYNGANLGAFQVLSTDPLLPLNEHIRIGELCLKINRDRLSSDGILPREFDIIIDTAFYPTQSKYAFSPPGGESLYAPDSTFSVVINVVVADTIVVSDTDTLFLDADDTEPVTIPTVYALGQNYPNPCNPTTTIDYSLKTRGHVELSIYNILGRKVRTLVSGDKDAGWHEVIWDGKDDAGANVSTGVYFYKMKSSEYINTKKMLILK